MPLHVFISYSSKDIKKAAAVWEHLRADGHAVYFAEKTAKTGTKLSSELEQQIKGCDVFIVLWSQNAKDSDWVSQEIGIAQGAGRTIMPVILEEGLNLPGFIQERKYLPAYKGFEEALASLSADAKQYANEKTQKEIMRARQESKDKSTSALVLLGLGALVLWALKSE